MSDEEFLDWIRERVPCRLRTWRNEADGHLMVGYLHDLTEHPALGIEAGDRICREWAEQLLRMDFEREGGRKGLLAMLGLEL